MKDASQLLREYCRTGSEDAFRDLMRCCARLVYSVAKRRVHSVQAAEDDAQQVFSRLAQSPPRRLSEPELLAWLHRMTLHVAIDVWRAETRSEAREQQAAAIREGVSP